MTLKEAYDKAKEGQIIVRKVLGLGISPIVELWRIEFEKGKGFKDSVGLNNFTVEAAIADDWEIVTEKKKVVFEEIVWQFTDYGRSIIPFKTWPSSYGDDLFNFLKLHTSNHTKNENDPGVGGMMRPIKFRAKVINEDRWVYGGGVWTFGEECTDLKTLMLHPNENGMPTITFVNPETVGELIGLHDKDCEDLWEGDVTEIEAMDGAINRFVIKYGIARRVMDSGWEVDIPCFYFECLGNTARKGFKAFPIVCNYEGKHDLTMMKKIGNIHDNPELMEVK